MADPEADAWPLMMQLVMAGINPAILEAYRTQKEIPAVPDSSFFKEALETLGWIQQALGSGFDVLSMEGKIVLIDLISEAGQDAVSQGLMGVDKSSEDAVLQAIILSTSAEGPAARRAINFLLSSRLDFAEPSLSLLREGDLTLKVGSKGPAVRYLHRLLQVSQRALGTRQMALEPFDEFHFATSTAIKEFEAKAFEKAGQLQSPGVQLGRYTLAFLEVVVFFAKPPKLADLPKQGAGMMVLGKKEHLVKVEMKDFAEFMLLRTKIWFANTPAADNPELKLGESDVKRFKYLLAYVQEAEKAEIEKLTKLGKRIANTLEKKGKGIWEDIPDGGKLAIICVPASLILWSADMAAKGKPTSLHETVLQITSLVLKQFSPKLIKPKKDANLQTTPYTLKGKLSASPWKQTLKDAAANETEVHGLKLGGSLSFSRNKSIPVSAYSSRTALQAQGWSDQRVWYCEKTCEAYRTDELRALYLRKEFAAEDTVIELTSEECKLTRLDEIPAVVVPVLFSTTKKKFSVDLEGSTTLSKGLNEVPSLFKVQCTWLHWTMSAEARTQHKDTKIPSLANPNNPGDDKQVTGWVEDLKLTLQRKILLGLNTSRRTSELDLLASIQNTKETYPIDALNTHIFTTTAGMTWKVTRQDHRTLSFALMGSLYDNLLDGGKDKAPEAQFRMEAVSRRLTLYVDTKVQFSGGPELSSLTFRCFYTLGSKP